jgi:hypothetical protein
MLVLSLITGPIGYHPSAFLVPFDHHAYQPSAPSSSSLLLLLKILKFIGVTLSHKQFTPPLDDEP